MRRSQPEEFHEVQTLTWTHRRPWWRKALDKLSPSKRQIAREWAEHGEEALRNVGSLAPGDVSVIDGTATGGSFVIQFGGEMTEPIAHDASAFDVELGLLRLTPGAVEERFGPPLVWNSPLFRELTEAEMTDYENLAEDALRYAARRIPDIDIDQPNSARGYIVSGLPHLPGPLAHFAMEDDGIIRSTGISQHDIRTDSVTAMMQAYGSPFHTRKKIRLGGRYMGVPVKEVIEALRG
mgnify:CR=1 FL=1